MTKHEDTATLSGVGSSDVLEHGWVCDLGNGEFDHDWEWVSDWYGDPGVINGTADCSYYRCRVCGAEDHESPPPTYDDDVL